MTLETTQGVRADDTNSQVRAEAEGFEPSIRGLPRNRISSVIGLIGRQPFPTVGSVPPQVRAVVPSSLDTRRPYATVPLGAIRVPSTRHLPDTARRSLPALLA